MTGKTPSVPQGPGCRPREATRGVMNAVAEVGEGTRLRAQRLEAEAGGWRVWDVSMLKAHYASRVGGERV